MKRAALWLAVAVPLLLGILIGATVRASVFVWAAIVQGYMIGRGYEHS